MKNLNDLGINPKNILKNDELLSLKGGINCICMKNGNIVDAGSALDLQDCKDMCSITGGTAVLIDQIAPEP